MELFDGSERERKLLIGLGALLGVLIILFGITRLGGGDADVADSREAALRDLQIVQSFAGPMDSVAAERTAFDRRALLRAAQGAGLTLSRVEPGANGALQVVLEPAPSATILGFLEQLERGTAVRITALEMEAVDGGEVEASIAFAPA